MASKPPDKTGFGAIPKSAPKLRSDSAVEVASTTRAFNLVPLNSFDTSKFPTNSEVLRRIFFLLDLSKPKSRPINSIADQIFKEMENIYIKALAIEKSTKQPSFCKAQICKLYEDFRYAQKNYKKDRPQQQKVQLFLDNLDKMCDIAPPNAEQQIRLDRLRPQMKKDEDISFLNDQKTTRKQTLGKVDIVHSKKSDAKFIRDTNAVKQLSSTTLTQSPAIKRKSEASPEPLLPRFRDHSKTVSRIQSSVADDSDLGTKDDKKVDPDFVQSRFLRDRPQKKNIISKDSAVLKAGDRGQTSTRHLVNIVGAALVENGEDLNEHVFSHRTAARNRPQMRAAEATKIKALFKPPNFAGVHFDGKQITDSSGKSGERLAVMLSGNTPDCLSGKLLSACLIKDGTGKAQADEVVRALHEWKAAMNVVSMCFDTTSSNTGWQNGAATLIEKFLEKITKQPLIWFPCRRHIDEIFLGEGWESLFGVDMAPFYQDFKEFQKLFPN